ncbi:uncharacterized protein LOC134177969, partial [Corticium candelabrum]|uniref:uncharacterized protein LOC134177969 n=1 Tax=Corticium candelabrum TaxID=121492 RepID=UPI002E263420
MSKSILILFLQLSTIHYQVSAQSKRACTANEFICTDGQCVSSQKRCDGNLDCHDRSDENCCDQNSNSGKEFVLGFMANYQSKANLYLFLTSPKSLNYTVVAPTNGFSQSGYLLANTLVSVQLPTSLLMPYGISDRGILVRSTEDMTVYGLNQEKYSTDAFLALPTYIQGLQYVVPSYTQKSASYQSLIGIVGIHNNTQVTIVLASSASDGTKSHNAGANVTYTINWMETLQLQGYDLTGSRVYSDKTVAVFGGHECVNIPVGTHYCDHLVEQVPPITTLGKHFATVPLATRAAGDRFRAIASKDGTDVTINGQLQASNLQAGQFHEFTASSTTFLSIEAAQPILLMQYSQGSTVDSTKSDPFMLMIPPVEQYRSRYIISTPPDRPAPFSNYLAIIVTDDKKDGLRLDDQPLPSSVVWNNIPGQTLAGANVPISIGSHTIHHVDKSNFGLSIYGFEDDDSYGYPGGLQLKAQCVVQTPDQITDIDECALNNGRGPCQYACTNTFGSFQCSCQQGYFLQADRVSCRKSAQQCLCSSEGNGICISGGFCECRVGWGGLTCSDPQCHLVNHCSGKGKCIAPNKCQCNKGWTGFGCAVSTCPQFTTCSACSEVSHCGWCDSQQKCMTGTGFGPSDKDTFCPEWFFYRCITVNDLSIDGNTIISTNTFSSQIQTINCDDSCIVSTAVHRGNSISTPGSQVFCERRKRACRRLSHCYEEQPDLACALKNNAICRVHSEIQCPGGQPSNRWFIGSTNQPSIIAGGDYDNLAPKQDDIAKTKIDFKFHVYCATLQNLSEWNDYGCFCDSSKTADLVIDRQPVDETDKCCKEHEKCYSAAPSSCDCHKVQSFAYNAGCNDWKLDKGFCEDVFLTSQNNECKRYCCQCDFTGAECLAHGRNTKVDKLWHNWLDPTKSQCNQKCGKVTGCDCKPECSGNGFIESVGRDSFCFCFPGWQGQCCDQPDCSCHNSNYRDCSGNGVCRAAIADNNPSCTCSQGWRGPCCDSRIPVRRSGDPHLSTADGLEFDYFGIGEFWDCRSKENDFGVQLRFFGYKTTSFTGAVAIKTGNITTTIYTLNNSTGQTSLPKLRINGTLLKDNWADYPTVHTIDSDYVRLYVQPTRANGSVVQYLFQFNSGATYTVDVRYSS